MILLRHGQSEFNLHFSATRRDPGIPDPKLTPLGLQQAEAAAEALAGEGLRRILVSPYTRALQTAAPIARRLGMPVLVNPVVRERYAFACDVGTRALAAARAWPEHDFSGIDEVWWPAVEEPTEARAGPRGAVPGGDGGARRTGPTRWWSAIGASSCRSPGAASATASGSAATRPRRRRPRSSGASLTVRSSGWRSYGA